MEKNFEKLEAGGFYKNRLGEIVKVRRRRARHFEEHGFTYSRACGYKIILLDSGRVHETVRYEVDLIERVEWLPLKEGTLYQTRDGHTVEVSCKDGVTGYLINGNAIVPQYCIEGRAIVVLDEFGRVYPDKDSRFDIIGLAAEQSECPVYRYTVSNLMNWAHQVLKGTAPMADGTVIEAEVDLNEVARDGVAAFSDPGFPVPQVPGEAGTATFTADNIAGGGGGEPPKKFYQGGVVNGAVFDSLEERVIRWAAGTEPPMHNLKREDSPKPVRQTTLEAAIKCTVSDREAQYGGPTESFTQVAARWSQVVGVEIAPHMVPIMLADLKIVRMLTSPQKADNYVDGAGYLGLAAEVAGAE